MPPQMRALPTSYCRSSTVAKWRSPRPVRLGTVKSICCVPRNLAMTRPPAGVMQEWALGYSGWFGVAGSSGDQAGSPTVAAVAVRVAGADRGDRPPERVVVLRVEAGDEGVGVGHGDHRHEPCRLDDVQLVVEDELAERATGLLHRGLRPEPGGQGLLGGPRRARARADLLDLVVLACPPLAAQLRRSVRPELVGGVEAERLHEPEVGADRRRGRGRDPHAGDRRVRRRVGHRRPEAVAGTQGDERGGDAPRRWRCRPSWPGRPGSWPATRCRPDRRSWRLSRQVVDENAVGGRGHRGLGRGTRRCVDVDRERLVPALHRHHRVVDRDRHVGEDRVALGRRQRRRAERLGADASQSVT